MIIGLSGKARSGKDTMAAILIKNFNFERFSFADTLKNEVSKCFDIELKYFHDDNLKDSEYNFEIKQQNIEKLYSSFEQSLETIFPEDKKDKVFSFVGKKTKTPRELLQVIGTDLARNCLDDEIWIKLGKKRLKNVKADNIIITDCRFENERKAIKDMGGNLGLVKREGLSSSSSHISENQFGNDADYDYIFLNNGTLGAFESEVILWFTLKRKSVR